MAATVLAVDGNSLAHRAWHALREERFDGPWVAHGVVRMLATAWAYGPFDAVLVAFDSRTNVRKVRYPDYKANREDKDPAFHEQFSQLREVVGACGFGDLVTEGYEADDVLAAVAAEAAGAGHTCYVLSSDRDLLALVSDRVWMLRPRGSMQDLTVYDPAGVEAEFGVPPERYMELAALRGDTSDNLPGVHGIGAKTAAKLLRSFGNLAELYAGLRWLPHDTANKLRAGREHVDRNLELMAPMGEHAIGVEAAVALGVDVGHVVATLRERGLRAAANSFRFAYGRQPEPPPPPPIQDRGLVARVDLSHLLEEPVPDAEQTALF
ncbi:MAG TPA: 5'-3' exonuclease H3TH domain-containing protein [Nitriliruptorales bacterium]